MPDRRLVSAITGTYPPRLPEMLDAMRNLRASTYPNLEHCIAVEGDNRAEVHETVFRIEQEAERLGCADSTYVVGLGRWWSRYLAASISAIPFQVAQWMASGDYLMWFADDERMTPDHVERLVDLLEERDVDFVYPYVRITFAEGLPYGVNVIGTDPPAHGQITHALYRADLVDYRGFEHHIGSGSDWDQVSVWLAAGASWAMLEDVTFEHRADKLGEGSDYREDRRPLRGHRVGRAG
jgi:hypothetical protein